MRNRIGDVFRHDLRIEPECTAEEALNLFPRRAKTESRRGCGARYESTRGIVIDHPNEAEASPRKRPKPS